MQTQTPQWSVQPRPWLMGDYKVDHHYIAAKTIGVLTPSTPAVFPQVRMPKDAIPTSDQSMNLSTLLRTADLL